MNRKNLLYLNLSVDEKDVSLGFAKTWTDQFSKNFDNVDIITLKKPVENIEYQNVRIYGITKDNKYTKFNKYKQIKNIIQKLTTETNYDLCFSHMSPLLIILSGIYSKNRNIPRVLWYTHPKPKELSKRIILQLSLFFSNRVVTASNSSFPYKSKKLNVIGHAIDYELFQSRRNNLLNKDFIILSRISKSKNIELALDSFLKSKFKNNLITIVGDSVTSQDKEYKKFLENKYKNNDNVIFKGKVPHNNLPTILSNYSFHINATASGFYDKSVLETLSAGLFNFYSNTDYNKLFSEEMITYTNFKLNNASLTDNLNAVYDLKEKTLLEIVKLGQKNASNESIRTIFDRVITTIES
jgi:glycosyltransferase involved in cell wall biosynthesis